MSFLYDDYRKSIVESDAANENLKNEVIRVLRDGVYQYVLSKRGVHQRDELFQNSSVDTLLQDVWKTWRLRDPSSIPRREVDFRTPEYFAYARSNVGIRQLGEATFSSYEEALLRLDPRNIPQDLISKIGDEYFSHSSFDNSYSLTLSGSEGVIPRDRGGHYRQIKMRFVATPSSYDVYIDTPDRRNPVIAVSGIDNLLLALVRENEHSGFRFYQEPEFDY